MRSFSPAILLVAATALAQDNQVQPDGDDFSNRGNFGAPVSFVGILSYNICTDASSPVPGDYLP